MLGVSRINPTPNAGRIAITLRPRGERAPSADEIVERLKQAVAPLPGMTVYFQPVQDIQISTRREPRAVSVHAGRRRLRPT